MSNLIAVKTSSEIVEHTTTDELKLFAAKMMPHHSPPLRLGRGRLLGPPDFVRASLLQLQGAARSPFGTISELAINAALAMIEAAAPKDEIEAALAIQMTCCHTAAMAVLAKMDSGFGTERRIAAFGSTAARLMKT